MNARTKYYLDKEKVKVEEIISFAKNNVIVVGTPEYDSFYALLKDLVMLEASINDIKYTDEKDGEISFQIKELKSDDTSGLCYRDIYLNEEGRFVRGTVDLIVNSNTHYFEELASDKPELREHAAKRIIKTVYHEFAHFMQSKSFVTHLSNDRSLKSAKEFIYLEGRYGTSRVYQDNHDSFSIENEADLQAHMRFSYVLDDSYDAKKKINCLSKYYACDLLIRDGDKKLIVSREDIINNYIDYLITKKKMKFLLMKYPILQKEYTFECKRKTFVELALKYKSEIDNLVSDLKIEDDKRNSLISDTKEMYFGLFNRCIINASKEEINEVIGILGIETFEEIVAFNTRKFNEETNILYNYYYSRNGKVSKYNHIKLNTKGYFARYEGTKAYTCSFSEMRKIVGFDNYNPSEQQKIDTWFIAHIPECGYFLSKKGELMEPLDFFETYFLPNMKKINDFDSFFSFLEEYTESENALLYEVGRRRIVYNSIKQNYYWNKAIMEYKEEMKL